MGATHKTTTVLEFYKLFYNAKLFERGGELLTETFVNHHRGATGKGRAGMIEDFRRASRDLPNFTIEVIRNAEDGDFVWVHGIITGLPHGRMAMTVDIWRFEDGKIAEHWDVGQAIEPEEMANAI